MRLFAIVGTVGAKALKQTGGYRDERMPRAATEGPLITPTGGNGVAPEGR